MLNATSQEIFLNVNLTSTKVKTWFLAQLSQQQRCLYNGYVVTKSYMLQAFNGHDTYHTPFKWKGTIGQPCTYLPKKIEG